MKACTQNVTQKYHNLLCARHYFTKIAEKLQNFIGTSSSENSGMGPSAMMKNVNCETVNATSIAFYFILFYYLFCLF